MESLDQKIFSQPSPFPRTINIRRSSIYRAGDAITHLLQNQSSSSVVPIGIACHTSDTGDIDFMSLANTATAFLILFDEKKVQTLHKDFSALLSAGGDVLVGSESKCCLVGFSMARTAVRISEAMKLRVKGVDLGNMDPLDNWAHKSPVEIVVKNISSNVDQWMISLLWLGSNQSAQTDICLQAWLAACVGSRSIAKIEIALKVDTAFINASERDCLSLMISQSDLRERYQPKEILSDFTKAALNKDGKFEIANSRYKTRVRRSEQTRVIMTDAKDRDYIGRAQGSKGKTTTISMEGNVTVGSVESIRVQGRQEPTNSEKARDELIHMVLTGQKDLRQSPLIRAVWFPKWKEIDPIASIRIADPSTTEHIVDAMKLNDSQRSVVRAMTCDMPMVVAHGPPGTGKTTTISATSCIWGLHKYPVWIVAHSNVAVKNIAESLFKRHVDYKLLVSKEFYDEWHEHLYVGVQDTLIRSDELPKDSVGMERMLGDSHIVLCTLSMISNPMLQDNGTFKIVPMERLIIDEASQIDIFEFLHIFERFHGTLGKVCFFGDPKQLPPYGKDNIPSIKTIFDVMHISNSTKDFFLDTQYRMPVPIGDFISTYIYDGRLKSVHSIQNDRCVAFIDVPISRGFEEKAGNSWKNEAEIQSLVHIIKFYYKYKNFCVITPYDPQRAAIQRALEAENLPADSVFAVDSFQGNEADYIIISTVRTGKPGFLVSPNRMNVLLSRCKKAMVILTSRTFIKCGGARTLLGTLATHWTKRRAGVSGIWIDWSAVANGVADLPDAFGPNQLKRQVPCYSVQIGPTVVHEAPFPISRPKIDIRTLFNKRQQSWGNFGSVRNTTPSEKGASDRTDLDKTYFPPLSTPKRTLVPERNLTSVVPNKYSLLPKRPITHHHHNKPVVRSGVRQGSENPTVRSEIWTSRPQSFSDLVLGDCCIRRAPLRKTRPYRSRPNLT